jgi:flagellar basal-body rod modification protein FlgD
MTTTHSINGNIPAAGSSLTPPNMQINQTDFLRLITTQLRNQNPLSPADPTQFVTQLEGMSEVSSMQSMQNSLQASQVMSGTALIGRSVLAPGSSAVLATGGSLSGAVTAPAGASRLTVSILDASGVQVSSFGVTPQAGGLTPFSWNGLTSAGTGAAPGTYRVAVNATVNGATQPVAPLVYSKVDSVLLDPSTQAVDLNTDAGTIALGSVVSIR